MDVKRYRQILWAVILCVIIASLTAIYVAIQKQNQEQEMKSVTTQDYAFYLKEYNNQIGIFRTNETEPFDAIDIYIYNLPSVDQYELKDGILVKNEEMLRMIIEDYES